MAKKTVKTSKGKKKTAKRKPLSAAKTKKIRGGSGGYDESPRNQ